MTDLIILGTGHAIATKCYNTCFALRNEHGIFLTDAGGGNGILAQMEKAGLSWTDLRGLYITHAHTDHILGCIWVLRFIAMLMQKGKYQGDFEVYGFAQNLEYLKNSAEFMLFEKLSERIHFNPIVNESEFDAIGIHFKAFDILSDKKDQIGYRARIPKDDGTFVELSCPGDETLNENCYKYVMDSDYFMHEAFCLYADRDIFHPYEIFHSTSKDAGRIATEVRAKCLIMYHTEDSNLKKRRKNYGGEAKAEFAGKIYVPRDLDVIPMV